MERMLRLPLSSSSEAGPSRRHEWVLRASNCRAKKARLFFNKAGQGFSSNLGKRENLRLRLDELLREAHSQ